jgi:glutathione synthase/RimK-type ligase-like ATP-grasp enzyme
MKTLGLLCNLKDKKDPKSSLSPSVINRAFLIDRLLKPSGIEVFLYSPRDVPIEDVEDVNAASDIPGYRIAGDELLADARPVPRVNANWTYATRRLIDRGMGYRRFKRWTKENGISVYVPFAFSEMVSDKHKTYSVVEENAPGLHPYTEDYIGSRRQVETFFARSESIFLKPRAGSKGNQIFVLRRAESGITLRYYDHGQQRVLSPLTMDAALGVVEAAAGDKNYIVQEGVQSLRYEGSVFDVRVVMVNDSENWHSILETRLAPADSDLSNIFQGGTIEVTEELFDGMLGAEEARKLEKEIRRVSHGLAEHLGMRFPGDLSEIGFDMLIDSTKKLRLVEVNAKPGVAGIGSENRIFDWKPEDGEHYERWVLPHVSHLAKFLSSKIDAEP